MEQWEDPTDWVISHLPWTAQQSSSGSADWPPTLLRLRAEDTPTCTDDQMTSSQLRTGSGGGGSSVVSTSTRPPSTTSADDPLVGYDTVRPFVELRNQAALY